MIHAIVFWINSSKYFLLFAGTFLEGPVVMMSAGFLWRIGQFSLLPMFLCLAAGDFVADICWYFVGYYGGRPLVDKFGKFFNLTEPVLLKIEDRFHKYQTTILVISKLTMGFGFAIPTLITAGLLKVSFKKYVAINFFGGLIWTAIMITVGYLFGNLYYVIPDSTKAIFAVGGIILAFFVVRGVNQYLVKAEI